MFLNLNDGPHVALQELQLDHLQSTRIEICKGDGAKKHSKTTAIYLALLNRVLGTGPYKT